MLVMSPRRVTTQVNTHGERLRDAPLPGAFLATASRVRYRSNWPLLGVETFRRLLIVLIQQKKKLKVV